MELAQEVYELLNGRDLEWPDHAVCVMRDGDGEIKFSSVNRHYIPKMYEEDGQEAVIYVRGEDCLYNTVMYPSPEFVGTYGAPDSISVHDYEAYVQSIK